MQKIEHTVYSICYTGIIIVFVKSKYVLPKKISKNSNFAGSNLVVAANREEEAHAIILYFHKSNTQICQKRQLSFYHKVDLTVLWFINTVGCQQCLILTLSMQANAFTISCFFDNRIYKSDFNGNVPVYNIYDIITRQFIRYFDFKNWESKEILVKYN